MHRDGRDSEASEHLPPTHKPRVSSVLQRPPDVVTARRARIARLDMLSARLEERHEGWKPLLRNPLLLHRLEAASSSQGLACCRLCMARDISSAKSRHSVGRPIQTDLSFGSSLAH